MHNSIASVVVATAQAPLANICVISFAEVIIPYAKNRGENTAGEKERQRATHIGISNEERNTWRKNKQRETTREEKATERTERRTATKRN